MTAAEDEWMEGEWEYEYDNEQTEDVYFTLDLSAFQSSKSNKPATLAGKAQKLVSNRRTSSVPATRQPNGPLSTQPAATPTTLPKPTLTATAPSDEERPKLQVLDLHTDNPLVLFDTTLYSCHWSDTYGSQVYVARKGDVKPSLRPGYVLDVVGLSQSKLVGKPSLLRERKARPPPVTGISVDNAITFGDDDAEEDSDEEGDDDDHLDVVADTPDDVLLRDAPTAQQRLATLRKKAQDPNVRARASFLERLGAIKQSRGEMDAIPVNGITDYRVSEEAKSEIKQRSAAIDAELAQKPASNKKRQAAAASANGTDGEGAKRRKPGPPSGAEVRSAMGFGDTATPVPSLSESQLPGPKVLTPKLPTSAPNGASATPAPLPADSQSTTAGMVEGVMARHSSAEATGADHPARRLDTENGIQ